MELNEKVFNFMKVKRFIFCGLSGLGFLLLLPYVAHATVQNLTIQLSTNTPAPGQNISVTLTYCENTSYQTPYFLAAISTTNTLQTCPAAGQTFVVDSNGVNVSDTQPTGGWATSSVGTNVCPTTFQQIWTLTIPANLNPGSTYYLIVAAGTNYVTCNPIQDDEQVTTSFTLPPPTPNFSISKSVLTNSSNPGGLIEYDLNYSYGNGALTLTDSIPSNTTFIQASSGGTLAGNTLTWLLPLSSAQTAGRAWFLTQVNDHVAVGTSISNTASADLSGLPAQNSNTTSVTIGPSFQITKTESSTTALQNASVTYSLDWSSLGTGLLIDDTYSSGSITGFDGSSYVTIASNGTLGSWSVLTDSQGNAYLSAYGGGATGDYPSILRSNVAVNLCEGFTEEGNLMISPSNTNGQDATMVMVYNSATQSGYMIGISGDPIPFNFFLQKSTVANPTTPTFPDGVNNGSSSLPASILDGDWYTVKVQVIPSGSNLIINAKVWPRGTAEPANWTFSYTDTSPLPCVPTTGTYQAGWQADIGQDYYSHLRLFGAGPASNVLVYDTLPANVVYQGASSGGTFNGSLIAWPLSGTTYYGSGAETWWGQVQCASNIVNQSSIISAEPVSATNSNSVTLSVTCLETPTPTSTPSPTPTPINPETPTPTVTPTPSSLITPSFTPESTLHVWPNPFYTNLAVGGTLKIATLPAGAIVSFYTVSGELVNQFTAVNQEVQWNGRNMQGRLVATGIYIYVIQVNHRVLQEGKIILVDPS
jgi:hypothetical protein